VLLIVRADVAEVEAHAQIVVHLHGVASTRALCSSSEGYNIPESKNHV